MLEYLDDRLLLRTGAFVADVCHNASLDDINKDRIKWFIRRARYLHGFPLSEEATRDELLTHLNLLNNEHPSNAAVLLFGNAPQRYLFSSFVKCAHFHGTEIMKPIPSHQMYKGTLFDMVDAALDFVLSKIDASVAVRAGSAEAQITYEIPPEAIREAIVNAVAHRDYTSNGSVQVMLFKDRLEVWNPGSLPPSWNFEDLRQPHASVPANPLLAQSLYLAGYIEQMGTGTLDMMKLCAEAGLAEPEFFATDGFVTRIWRKNVTGQATGQVTGQATEQVTGQAKKQAIDQATEDILRLLFVFQNDDDYARNDLQSALDISSRSHFTERYLDPAIQAGYVALTLPDKPTSPLQKYRLTDRGQGVLKSLKSGNASG